VLLWNDIFHDRETKITYLLSSEFITIAKNKMFRTLIQDYIIKYFFKTDTISNSCNRQFKFMLIRDIYHKKEAS
jgi:hypothetical protein